MQVYHPHLVDTRLLTSQLMRVTANMLQLDSRSVREVQIVLESQKHQGTIDHPMIRKFWSKGRR